MLYKMGMQLSSAGLIMTPEQDKELCLKYPNLFKLRDTPKDISNYPICWGFECDSGWFSIIDNLCFKLNKIIETVPKEEQENYYVLQCKEKFGTLRYYMSCETEEMSKVIQETEDLSASICEFCGNPGTLDTSQYWVKTLCPTCSKERKKLEQ
jgi:hypothetical protein